MINENIMNIFHSYSAIDIATIPCKKVFDEKTQCYTGKVAAVQGWQNYCNDIPSDDEIEGWRVLNNVWGVAAVCGEASNLCCVDVDTADPELQKRIIESLPYTPLVIKGDPRRAGKYIYRLTESVHNYTRPVEQKVKIPEPMNPKKSAVDVFFGNAYICLPPSLHTETKDGKRHFYTWENDYNFHNVPFDEIPVLPPIIVEQLRMVVDGMTKEQVKLNMGGMDLSQVSTSDDGARWQNMTNLAGGLIKSRVPFDEAVNLLLKNDEERNGDNPYFADATKGCKCKHPRINAIKFYSDILYGASVKKKSIHTVEVPKQMERSMGLEVDKPVWGPLKSIEEVGAAPKFDINLVPENIRETVIHAAEATAVPPQFVFFYMLGTFSTCLGNKVLVQPWHSNREFVQPSNLYIGLVARSGERKSETTRIGRKALLKVHKEQQDKMKELSKIGAQKNEDIEFRIAKIRKDVQREIEENGHKSEFAQTLREEIESAEKEKVVIKQVSLYEQENTPESYYQVCEQNPSGVFIEFNEWGSTYDTLLSRENKKLRRFILDGWDGTAPFSYKTKRNGENHIEKLCLSVGFSVQETVMSSILWRVQNIGREDDGLIQRFLLVASDGHERPLLDRHFTIGESTYDIYRNAYEIEASEDPLMLDIEAYDKWVQFQHYIRQRVKDEKRECVKSFLSKYVGLVIRISCNIAHIRNGGRKVAGISIQDYDTAEKLIRYLEQTMLTLFKKGEFNQYREIINQMQMSVIQDGTSVRDLCRQHQGIFGKDAAAAMDRLRILHQHNYLRIVQDGKSYKIIINPELTGG